MYKLGEVHVVYNQCEAYLASGQRLLYHSLEGEAV